MLGGYLNALLLGVPLATWRCRDVSGRRRKGVGGGGGLVCHVARSVNEMRRASGTVGTKAAMTGPGYPVWTEAAQVQRV